MITEEKFLTYPIIMETNFTQYSWLFLAIVIVIETFNETQRFSTY